MSIWGHDPIESGPQAPMHQTMNDHPYSKLQDVWNRVTNAEYRVDSRAVADAIVRRRWTIAIGPEAAQVSVTRVRRVGRSRTRTGTRALA
jgi:hypothetical protein